MKATLIITLASCITSILHAQSNKQDVIRSIDSKYEQYSATAKKIWEFAEVGFQETQSSALLQKTLRDAGFAVQNNVAGMPTAFVASFGTGKPVIGILAEFDALPGVSQDATPELKAIAGKTAGHACGHHLFGVASSAAAIAVKDWLLANKKTGTIRLYGTRQKKEVPEKYIWSATDFLKTLTLYCIGIRVPQILPGGENLFQTNPASFDFMASLRMQPHHRIVDGQLSMV
jgi:hypothetical protein